MSKKRKPAATAAKCPCQHCNPPCQHPDRVWTHSLIGSPDSFGGVMDTYGWRCSDCGMHSGGRGVMSDWPDWVRERFTRSSGRKVEISGIDPFAMERIE